VSSSVDAAPGAAPAATSAAPAPSIQLRDLRFEYADGRAVIDGVDLSVSSGEIVGIVGPSGCGKSTLLSLIAGLNRPTSGEVHRRPTHRHPLSMMFQRDTLAPWLRARDNVLLHEKFGGRKHRRRGSGGAAADARADELLQLVGLGDRAGAFPNELSGGMRRRLAFLQAIAVEPEVLLLDEPFSSVDEPSRIGIHQDVFRIAKTMEMTTILVTHDLAEALTLCDRIIILSQRPSVVAHEHVVTFGSERDMTAIRESPEYLKLYASLWHDLAAEIKGVKR
jgi:NitT/TauT family transport system ATP-binding protein